MTKRVRWLVLLGLIAAVTAGCVRQRPTLDPAHQGPPVAVRLTGSEQVTTLALEDYIAGSVLAEADFRGLDDEAIGRVAEVQSILARTYALANLERHSHEGFDLCATTHCQVYRAPEVDSRLARQVLAAVRRTTGLVLSHDGRPINAVFHADCGGGTSDASVPWGGTTPPYLRGVDDRFCLRRGVAPWRFEADRRSVLDAIGKSPRVIADGGLSGLEITERDVAGRVVTVALSGSSRQLVRGEALRAALVAEFGLHSIKSTRFTLADTGDTYVFEGLGFGHGVGLCQRGAVARAQAGHEPEDILGHYYPGTSLARYY